MARAQKKAKPAEQEVELEDDILPLPGDEDAEGESHVASVLDRITAAGAETLDGLRDAMASVSGQGEPNAIEYGSEEHEALLSRGYGGMTRQRAETIIAERKANPALWPLDYAERAQAFLDALTTKPRVISTVQPWTRGERYEVTR